KPQDDCSTDVPESSGNSNPTATLTNPSADHMETLTVETFIPTISSLVSTACFTDSQEPSNESNGVEADVSNMETTITEPKKIFDALQDPSWVEAMQEELLQFKIQNVWTLVDCPKGEEGIDCDEVFAPVGRIKAIRLFLAYASFIGFTVYHMDVNSAFLYGTIDKKCELNFFLGLQVLQKEDGIFLSQDKYVGDILKKFGYSNVRSANTLMDKENPWGKDGSRNDVDLHHYRSMIGSLMYLTASRPDIMFAICACARHQVTPKE
nr:hypothetical protein [Tanacetum cinerariifolium]